MTGEILILFLTILGFTNAAVLHWQYNRFKNTGQPMVCIIGHGCTDVISSPYGTTLKIKNEVIGMYYYGLLFFLNLISILLPSLTTRIHYLGLTLAIIATLFSFYLLYVQSIILRKLCSWCLLAIVINLAITVVMISAQ